MSCSCCVQAINTIRELNSRGEDRRPNHCLTFGDGQNLCIVGAVDQERRLSVRLLVEFDLSCLLINDKPVVWI